MSEIRSIIAGTTKRSLVLVDEICRGTETAKGCSSVLSPAYSVRNARTGDEATPLSERQRQEVPPWHQGLTDIDIGRAAYSPHPG